MNTRLSRLLLLLIWGGGILWFAGKTAVSAYACGGLFCQNSPVDQNAERIIFVQNDNGTVTAIIQIQYTGFAEDFSWILPLPSAISADALEVPEDAMDAFTELELATNPVYLPPPPPDCLAIPEMALTESETTGDVEIFASGEVGPYGFDVIGSEDPEALITWLRENNYRVTPEMEPLINVYVEEQFAFLAMRLLPEKGTQDIQPIQVTYRSERPMIPLRLTAVAANPDMAVLTWFFADAQAIPVNYTHMEISDDEIRFTAFGNNYRRLMGKKADRFNGQAFITEYAGPTGEIAFSNPLLVELSQKHRYLTRLNTVISPEEMTVDPVFDYDPQRPDVSNIHDLSNKRGVYECEDGPNLIEQIFSNDESETNSPNDGFGNGIVVGVGGALVAGGLIGVGVWMGRRTRQK